MSKKNGGTDRSLCRVQAALQQSKKNCDPVGYGKKNLLNCKYFSMSSMVNDESFALSISNINQ